MLLQDPYIFIYIHIVFIRVTASPDLDLKPAFLQQLLGFERWGDLMACTDSLRMVDFTRCSQVYCGVCMCVWFVCVAFCSAFWHVRTPSGTVILEVGCVETTVGAEPTQHPSISGTTLSTPHSFDALF